MKQRYGIVTIFIIFLVAGIIVSLVNRYYTLEYLYNYLIKREFSVNPKVAVSPTRKYRVKIWYYPFFRDLKDQDEKEFFRELARDVYQSFPNINLVVKEIGFLEGSQLLKNALSEGKAPDIYINMDNDSLTDRKWQIPIQSFLSKEELKGFYIFDQRKENDRQIWGWPFLIHRQAWLANSKISLPAQVNIFDQINYLPKESLVFNFADLTLLKQLLSLKGLNKLELEDGRLAEFSYRQFEQVFSWLHQLRQKQFFAVASTTMEDRFLKAFFSEQKVVIGPVNSFLERFLLEKGEGKYTKVYLDSLVEVYTLNIFRQKKYQGDDHTRAVMEVARILSQNHGNRLAEKLELKKPFIRDGEKPPPAEFNRILEITPEIKEFWEMKVIPAWLDFWQKGLTPEEVMARLY